MTESYYNHPGEVREAMNFQCLHCDKIFTAPQGLDAHLQKVHNIDLRNFQFKVDWDVTKETAKDHTPTVNRKPSTIIYSGDRRMKSRKEKTHNLECLRCGEVYSSSPGMSGHTKRKHGEGAKINVNWQWSLKPTTISDLRSRAAQAEKGIGATATTPIEQPRTKRKYTRRQPILAELKPSPLILSPDSKYIEIPAVIRVPISVGQAEIIAQES